MTSGAESAPLDARRRDRRIAGWLGLCAFLAYLPFFHGHFMGTDERGVYLTTESLYERGSLEVPSGQHRYVGRDGNTYSHFALGLSLLTLPLYAAGDAAEHTLPDAWRSALTGRPSESDRIDTLGGPEVFAVSLYAPLASALLVALFFGFERRLGASVRSALVAAALLGGCSYVATQSVYFLRHTTEAITILAAFAALFAYREHGRLRDLAAGSAWASLTLWIAVPALVALPPIALYGLWLLGPRFREANPRARARMLACAAVPPLVAIAAHVALNQALWGTFLDSPMVAQRSRFSTPLYVGLWGFLLSPGASVFLYSPLLLLLPRTLPAFWRERRAECLVVTAVSLFLLLFCARFEHWHGLWSSPGPRYLFVLTPLLMLPLGRWLDRARRPGERAALFALAAIGAGIQLVLMLSRWSAVIRGMDYYQQTLRSGYDFLFVPAESPVLGSARFLLEGEVDAWLWGLATGWGGQGGAPLAAGVLLGLWALALAFALSRLRFEARLSSTSA